MPALKNRRLLALGAMIAGCSLSTLDDLKGEPSDAALDQCLGECVAQGGTGGLGDSSFGGGSGGTGGGDSAAEDGSDATSPCIQNDPGCQQCCVSTTGMGATDYLKAIHDCICTLTTVCQTDCMQYCQTQQLDAVCTACLGSSEVQQCLVSECASADCKAYTTCVAQC